MEDLNGLVQDLKNTFNQASLDTKEAVTTYKKFQIELLKHYTQLKNQQDMITAMEGLEIGAQVAVAIRDVSLFERIIQQLKQFYFDKNVRERAKKREYLIGLNLMFLLSQNRLADFHTEIEFIEYNDLQNKFIKFPMELEQSLMEGSYNNILNSRKSLPDPHYELFIGDLETTVRNEIADSLQVCHNVIPTKDALIILRINSINDLRQYSTQHERKWNITDKEIIFTPTQQASQNIDASNTAKDMLEFNKNN